MTELELINEKLDKIGTELFNKFGTDSYNIRCQIHDIKDQLKAINYSRCYKIDKEQLKAFADWRDKNEEWIDHNCKDNNDVVEAYKGQSL